MKLFFIVFLSGLLLCSPRSNATGLRCYHLFNVQLNLAPEALSSKQSERMMRPTRVNPNNTTSKRAEDKATLSKSVFEKIFARFKEKLQRSLPGYQIVLRDAVREGMHNVTWTRYSNKFALRLANGKVTTGVIRLRKYGWVPVDQSVIREHIEINPAFLEVSSLEFKIRDPDFESDQFTSVLKPIAKIYDRDANLLLSGQLTNRQKNAILKRTLELNSDSSSPEQHLINQQLVREMLDAIAGLRAEGNRFELSFESLYKRSAYKMDVTAPGSTIKRDVQITVDELISTYVVQAQAYSKIYKAEQPLVVVETKLPISFIDEVLSPNTSSVPWLASSLAEFIRDVRAESLHEFHIGKGKLGHTIEEFSDPRP